MKLNKQDLISKLGYSEDKVDWYFKMSELIPVEGDGTVDGRKLHELLVLNDNSKTHKDGTLQDGSRFNDWIAKRIKKYGFIENIDYEVAYSKKKYAHGR